MEIQCHTKISLRNHSAYHIISICGIQFCRYEVFQIRGVFKYASYACAYQDSMENGEMVNENGDGAGKMHSNRYALLMCLRIRAKRVHEKTHMAPRCNLLSSRASNPRSRYFFLVVCQ